MTAAREIGGDLSDGQDGLGAIVRVVSQRSVFVDRALHCCSKVGCRCAARHRIPILSVAFGLGICTSIASFCAALGLGPTSMWMLPWGRWTDQQICMADLVWWNCGWYGEDNSTCLAELARPTNKKFWQHMAEHCAAIQGGCLKPNRTSIAWERRPIATVSWLINPWGLCLFPASASSSWLSNAIAEGGSSETLVLTRHGGSCRPWTAFDSSWIDQDNPTLTCARPYLDGFALVMNAFGGFMKLFEPCSRMRRRTDQHQKTIVLLIHLISGWLLLLLLWSWSCWCCSCCLAALRPSM